MLLGVVLIGLYFAVWAVAIARSDNDVEAVRRYEAERRAFERMFE